MAEAKGAGHVQVGLAVVLPGTATGRGRIPVSRLALARAAGIPAAKLEEWTWQTADPGRRADRLYCLGFDYNSRADSGRAAVRWLTERAANSAGLARWAAARGAVAQLFVYMREPEAPSLGLDIEPDEMRVLAGSGLPLKVVLRSLPRSDEPLPESPVRILLTPGHRNVGENGVVSTILGVHGPDRSHLFRRTDDPGIASRKGEGILDPADVSRILGIAASRSRTSEPRAEGDPLALENVGKFTLDSEDHEGARVAERQMWWLVEAVRPHAGALQAFLRNRDVSAHLLAFVGSEVLAGVAIDLDTELLGGLASIGLSTRLVARLECGGHP